VVSNGDGYEKADNFGEEYVAAVERDFKHQTRQPEDHFDKLLEVTCPNHSYLVKHKLEDYTMMKNFMTLGAFSKGRKPGGEGPNWERCGTHSRGNEGHDNL
jgi:hypothetical protein